uniref:3-ketodihydrosphingosine reductase TSC10 n=1 Tax=Blastobotrys adeninivorans TaxID=409370 RepID=A0A060T9B3_BLAAD
MGLTINGRLTVISGGSQGLGASLAKVFVREGGNVVIVARTEAKLKEKVKELEHDRQNEQQRIGYIAADVSKGQECDRVFKELGESPDIVICCAGGATPGLFVEKTTEELDHNMNIVYNTALHFSHAALKVMTKDREASSRERHLIYCSSVLAVFSFIGYSSYGPGKAAIRALADIVRQECIPYNIRVHNLLPGNIDTEGFELEERTKPEITRKIEGPSAPRDPDQVAQEIVRDLRRGKETIYTDFIGWVLGGLQLGISPRSWGVFQALVAILFALFTPIWTFIMNRDIKNFFRSKNGQ